MKTLTLVLSILALLGAGASTYLYVGIGEQKQKLTQERDDQTKRADGLDADLKKSQEAHTATKGQLAAKDTELGNTKSQLQSEKARTTQLTRDLDAAKKAYAAKEKSEKELNTQVVTLREEIVRLRLAAPEGSSDEVKAALAAAEIKIKELEGQLTGDIGKSGSAQGGKGVPTRLLNTAVASVGTDNAFVILDVGNKQGAAIGQFFSIKRDGNEIARARVSAVRDELTIAQVEPKSIKSDLLKGDAASIIVAAPPPAAPAPEPAAPAAKKK
ncbi:hypothetical protein Ga0100231_020710 [Opitutaceae bacterium TAV4]|uniref:hypothetical protein n=1 Tax=Geminisphaera colitermitum TaxID=1148786 RepID=UPI000694FDD1|nr:hypothetical protein [Geminisphaera colitermitum]RRJ96317.1 hypothetical protein Ga0100231_020710 [Opitutaceae bacterium TAV4]RRK00462.1 hypothetical protein Ga0100230_021540 [Opitutaceae bacterium TAV3]